MDFSALGTCFVRFRLNFDPFNFRFFTLKQSFIPFLLLLFGLLFSGQLSAKEDDPITRLTKRLHATPNNCEKVNLYNKLTREYIYVDLKKATQHAHLGLALGKRLGCKKQLGDLYNSFAIVQVYSGHTDLALTYCDSAIAVYTLIHDKAGLAGAIGNKGAMYNNDGDYNKALKLQYKCLKLYKELRDTSNVATTLTNMFIVFHAQGDYKRANEVISEAYVLFDQLGEMDGKAMSTYNKAILFSSIGNADSCMYYSKRSVRFFQQVGNPNDIASGYAIYAIALNRKKQYRESITYADSALTIYKEIGHERKYLEMLQHNASCYFELKDYAKSTELAWQLLEEGKKRKLKQFERDGAKLLMENYEATGDYKKAVQYAKRYYELEGKILNENSISEINKLKSAFDFERKESDLKAATDKNKILGLQLDRKNDHLTGLLILLLLVLTITWFIFNQRRLSAQKKTAQLEHKALRAQMNPHFIFNSLNSIQRMYLEGNLDEANDFTGDFAQLMRRILDNSNKNLVSLQEEIDVLTLYLSLENLRCKDAFDYHFEISEEIDTHRVLIPPLVIQPFIENAIWHGILPKRQRGHIRIEMRRENKFIRCAVIDDGIGIQQKQNPFRESHGIHITEQRIGNKVQITSVPDQGTEVVFHILYQTK